MTGRVLVIDDSAVVRGMLSKIIAADPDLELAGTASNGAVGVEKAAKLKPDLIVLDVEMPVMNGLEALGKLRKAHPTTPIIMFSTLTAHGAEVSLEALANGASDYAMKPTNAGSSGSAAEQVKAELLVKLKGLMKRPPRAANPGVPGALAGTPRPPGAASPAGVPNQAKPAIAKTRRPPNKRVNALIIGSSTGGPNALEQVLSAISAPLPVPTLITQHLPPKFTKALADRLNRLCQFPVLEAEQGMVLEAGTCYIAPGGYHMGFAKSGAKIVVDLNEGPKVKSCRPSVDVMTDAARAVFGDQLVAVMLTGMGDDGADAFGRLAEVGVEIIAQDEATSVVWGMPGAVYQSGAADHCLPLNEVAGALSRAVLAGRPTAAAKLGGS